MISPTSTLKGRELQSSWPEIISIFIKDDSSSMGIIKNPYMKIYFENVDPNSMLYVPPTIVSVCLVFGALKCFNYLKEKFGLSEKDLSDPNKLDENGRTPLMFAAASGNLQLFIKVLETYKGSLNLVEKKYGAHVLHFAAKYNQIKIVKYICFEFGKTGSAYPATFENGTPLMWACKNNAVSVILFFLMNDLQKVNAVTKEKWTPLHYAVKANSIDAVKQLLLHNDIELIRETTKNDDPIDFAVRLGYVEILKLLLDANFLYQKENYIEHLNYCLTPSFKYGYGEEKPEVEKRIECVRLFLNYIPNNEAKQEVYNMKDILSKNITNYFCSKVFEIHQEYFKW